MNYPRVSFWTTAALAFVVIPALTMAGIDFIHHLPSPRPEWMLNCYLPMGLVEALALIGVVIQARRYTAAVFVMATVFFFVFATIFFLGGIGMNGVYL